MVFDDQHNAGLCGRVGFVRVLPRGRVGFVRVLPRVLDTSVLQVLVRRAKVRRVLVLVRLRRRYIWNSQIPLWQYCAQVLQYSTCLLVELIQLRTYTSIVTMTFTTSTGCSMHVDVSEHTCWHTQHACCNTQQQVCNNMLVRRCSMHAARLDSMFARVACMLQYTLLMCYLPTAYHLMVAQAAGLDGHVP